MKNIGEVSLPFEWRAWTALIDEDSEACSARLACRGLLRGSEREIDNQMPWIYGDKSDEGQDASLRVEMGNVG